VLLNSRGVRGFRDLTPILLLTTGVAVGSCGARTGLDPDHTRQVDNSDDQHTGGTGGVPQEEDPPECVEDPDCKSTDLCQPSLCVDGECVAGPPLRCDDADECTEDSCSQLTGECTFRPLSLDEDGDGFYGPRPGYTAGEPGSCGDDCNDASDRAYPGGDEICDGVDNDCNGVVDDNASYVPATGEAILVSDLSDRQAGGGGLAWNDDFYAVSYSAQAAKWQNYSKGLNADGSTAFAETSVTNHNSDAYAGNIAWTGASFGTAWQDRRNGNYEVFFNLLGPDGDKLGPDVRVTDSFSFSINVQMIWTGTEFLVVWQEMEDAGRFSVQAQRLSVEGTLIGGNVELVSSLFNGESPRLVEGGARLGLVFNSVDGAARSTPAFKTFAPDLTDGSRTVMLSASNGVGPSAVWSGGRYVITWGIRDSVPGDSIWGTTISEDGNIIVPERPLTFGAGFARTQSLLALGDRMLLTWADDKDGNYELYTKMLDLELNDLSPRQRITFDPSDSLSPTTTFGPDGDVGVLFDDRRSGSWHVYFARLVCRAGS
jgi:hypothetical protein